mgnify:CR=1 FL=1
MLLQHHGDGRAELLVKQGSSGCGYKYFLQLIPHGHRKDGTITSNVNNTIIRDNLILGRTDIKSSDFGILLFMYNDDNTDRFRYSPSDTLIYNNTIRYFSNGVGCDYYGYGNWGFNNVISSNKIVDN